MSAINNKNFELLSGNVTLYPGQRVIKIGDKLFPTGIGNTAMPVKPVKFYKCRAVHASSKTWDGYEVTFDSRGIADISTELTTGLQYTSVTPLLRQNIYSADGVQQVRGAMMSGTLPTPILYVSGEIPGGNIWASTMSVSTDGDGKGIMHQYYGNPITYTNYIDGQYQLLPGFPESASAHDWAFSIWGYDLFGEVLTIGGAGAGSGCALRLKVDSKEIYFTGDHNTTGSATRFTTYFDLQEWEWRNLVVSYSAGNRQYTLYINGEKWAEITEETAIDRPFNRFASGNRDSYLISHVYLFPEQITAKQAKFLAKQRWIFEGLQLSGLDDVYNANYGMDVSPNGTLTESGTYMFKPKYYASDPESGMSTCDIQWNGNEWEIFVYEYDENWNSIKKVIAYGMGGNDPSEAEWIDVGYGLAKIDVRYANGI